MAIKKRTAYKKYSRQKLSEVEGDLLLGKGAVIIAQNKTIIINGRIRNKGGFKCKGNLEVRSIRSDKGSVKIFGDLIVNKEVDVDRSLIVKGRVVAEEIKAGLIVKVDKGITSDSVKSGLKTLLRGENKIDSINSGTKTILHGTHTIGSINTGTKAKLFGILNIEKVSSGTKIIAEQGKITSASAGLSVIASGNVEIERASAGLSIKMNNGNLKNGSAGLSIISKRRLTFETLSAGLSVKLNQGGLGEKINAGLRIKSGSDLEATESLNAGLSCIAKGDITTNELSVGRKIIGKYIEAKTIRVAKKGKLYGIVQAERVVLNEKAKARNLYVDELEMFEQSNAKNVFAKSITVEDYAILRGKVEYTQTFEAEPKAKIRTHPKKVDSLPIPKR
ncbi:MAG: hypothetical protein JXA54_16270 [Candidatus Heimdallarchaeota archaeon]|nr:hypothetical protein [Candidatus Heimdallarchaeota archaeon]